MAQQHSGSTERKGEGEKLGTLNKKFPSLESLSRSSGRVGVGSRYRAKLIFKE
jgi:hypothetical protein